MQIVINTDEKRYKDILRISTVQLKGRMPTLEQVIANGTPLPKGHDRLVEAREVIKAMFAGKTIDDVSTIIEADKEEDVCKDCYYNDGEVHAECVICDKADKED